MSRVDGDGDGTCVMIPKREDENSDSGQVHLAYIPRLLQQIIEAAATCLARSTLQQQTGGIISRRVHIHSYPGTRCRAKWSEYESQQEETTLFGVDGRYKPGSPQP